MPHKIKNNLIENPIKDNIKVSMEIGKALNQKNDYNLNQKNDYNKNLNKKKGINQVIHEIKTRKTSEIFLNDNKKLKKNDGKNNLGRDEKIINDNIESLPIIDKYDQKILYLKGNINDRKLKNRVDIKSINKK